MADVPLTSVTGGSSLIRFAPDLTPVADGRSATNTTSQINFNPVGVLTTALSLSGRYYIPSAWLSNLVATDTYIIKVTIDGVVIRNETLVNPGVSTLLIYGGVVSNTGINQVTVPAVCESSLLIEVQSTTDTSVSLNHISIPIL